MGNYRHGIYTREVPTSLISMTEATAALPVYVGTAPVHLATDPAEANKAVLCYNYASATTQLGYSKEWDKYTLCEAMYSQFSLFGMAPVVFINVLDPKKHKKTLASTEKQIQDKVVTIEDPVLLNTLKVSATNGGAAATINVDYTATFNDEGKLLIGIVATGALKSATSVWVTYDYVDPSMVTADDIVGGVDTEGKRKGLELINEVFPRFGLIPGNLLAPGWSHNTLVAAVMKAKETTINGMFQAMSLCDAPTDEIKKATAVSEWKNKKNYVDERQILCWPKVALANRQFHLSTQLAGLMAKTDAKYDDIPYKSPSNESLQADSAVLKDGTEIYLGPDEAAYLNGQGVVTALNFIGGWRAWGNRTTAYPSNTDVKDSFIPVRRMFNWVSNTLITSFWSKIDDPANKRLINNIVNSANAWLNGHVASGALLGARVEFLESENPTTDLLNGILRFHVYLGVPTPAREIDFIQEYDPAYMSTLFN